MAPPVPGQLNAQKPSLRQWEPVGASGEASRPAPSVTSLQGGANQASPDPGTHLQIHAPASPTCPCHAHGPQGRVPASIGRSFPRSQATRALPRESVRRNRHPCLTCRRGTKQVRGCSSVVARRRPSHCRAFIPLPTTCPPQDVTPTEFRLPGLRSCATPPILHRDILSELSTRNGDSAALATA
jgi:hypothetical protein